MKTDIKWAELHAPLFLNGANLGMKLDPTKRQGMSMCFDEEKCHLYVTYVMPGKTETARIPETSILSMVEGSITKPVAVPPPSALPIKAQVSTPQDHVFAGDGKSKK